MINVSKKFNIKKFLKKRLEIICYSCNTTTTIINDSICKVEILN